MWASSFKELGTGASEVAGSRYLKNPHYCLAAKIDTGLEYDPEFSKNIREFARTFGMSTIDIKGSVEVVEQSYLNAKKSNLKMIWG